MKRFYLALVFLGICAAHAQNALNSAQTVMGQIQNRSTLNSSVNITTSGSFQTVFTSIISAASLQGFAPSRQEMTIQNNSSSIYCWLYFGSNTSPPLTSTYILPPFTAFHRDWPFVPSDAVQATCQTNGSLYIDSE